YLTWFLFVFNDTATTEIYTLSLHDALPTSAENGVSCRRPLPSMFASNSAPRSEEHTSELQSHLNIVCRLLLEKKKTTSSRTPPSFSNYRSSTRPTYCRSS